MYQGKYSNQTSPSPRPRTAPRKKKKTARTSTKVFYSALLAIVLIFIIAMAFAMNALKEWLVSFEASQPTAKCDQVFAELFQDPDWEKLYDLAGEQDSHGVNAQSFASYMEDKIGDTKLTCIETSAGLSGDKKFIVRCGSEKVATFTLTNTTPDNSIPTWELGAVDVFYSSNQTVNIITVPGYKVTVDGTELDESYIIRLDSTKAEEYLPEGVHGYQLCEMTVGNLLARPTVEVFDTTGAAVALNYDADTRTYSHATQVQDPLTKEDEEYDTLMTVARTYCEYMIGKTGKSTLKKYFDSDTEIYKTITTNTTWMQKYSGYDFGEETIDGYYRYSDNLYSARVNLTLKVTRKDGSIKEYELNNTFFMEKQDDSWMVVNMINADAQETVRSVRLTYVAGNETLSSELVDAHTTHLMPPAVEIPEGKAFKGWFVEHTDEKGKTTLELAFLPDEDGSVYLPGETALEPMTLKALFQ